MFFEAGSFPISFLLFSIGWILYLLLIFVFDCRMPVLSFSPHLAMILFAQETSTLSQAFRSLNTATCIFRLYLLIYILFFSIKFFPLIYFYVWINFLRH